jgi:hypothetical protein
MSKCPIWYKIEQLPYVAYELKPFVLISFLFHLIIFWKDERFCFLVSFAPFWLCFVVQRSFVSLFWRSLAAPFFHHFFLARDYILFCVSLCKDTVCFGFAVRFVLWLKFWRFLILEMLSLVICKHFKCGVSVYWMLECDF